jgi:hypothetical protein
VQAFGAGVFGGVGGDGLMRWVCFVAALMLPGSVKCEPAKQMMFGDKWIAKDGEHHRARLDIMWASWSNPLADFVRNPSLDEDESILNTGSFPMPMPADETANGYEAYVDFAISVGVDGVPTDCSILSKSQSETVNAHICPHVIKYAKFHAPINEDGQRLAFRGEFSAIYRTRTKVVIRTVALPGDEAWKPNSRNAAPNKPIDVASLGLGDNASGLRGRVAKMLVKVGETGNPVRCDLTQPTFIDSVDAVLCKIALSRNFIGALSHKGEPVADWVSLEIKF